jgi:hypothetical protein
MPNKAITSTNQIFDFPFKVKWPHGKVVGTFTSLKIVKLDFKLSFKSKMASWKGGGPFISLRIFKFHNDF